MLQNNFNQLSNFIKKAQMVQDPIAYLQSQAINSPLIQKALELNKQYNGDSDAATRDLLKLYGIDEQEARTVLSQLGIK